MSERTTFEHITAAYAALNDNGYTIFEGYGCAANGGEYGTTEYWKDVAGCQIMISENLDGTWWTDGLPQCTFNCTY